MTIADRAPSIPFPPQSRYLQYLPGIYADGWPDVAGWPGGEQRDFLNRFLMIFESVFAPVEDTVGSIEYYFDPRYCPEELLDWLAQWLDVELPQDWAPVQKRRYLRSAMEIYRWRGTKRGLAQHISVFTGVEPNIIESFGGIPLDGSARLGENMVLDQGSSGHFEVEVNLAGTGLDRETIVSQLNAIIAGGKPAYTTFTLTVRDRAGDAEEAAP